MTMKTTSTQLTAAVMAAGKGTRMYSETTPKVLHTLAGRSMILHVLQAANELVSGPLHVIVGHGREQVRAHVQAQAPADIQQRLVWVEQLQQLGTGHAVQQLLPVLPDYHGHLLILNGDVPLLSPETLKELWHQHLDGHHVATLLTTRLDDPDGYGRIIKNNAGKFISIREDKDCNDAERKIREVNTGIYLFDWTALAACLPELSNDNAKQEYYLTDVLGMLVRQQASVGVHCIGASEEVLGINSRLELAEVEEMLQQQLRQYWMERGVTLRNPASIYIDCSVELAQDVEILPGTTLLGQTRVGKGARIGPNTLLQDAQVGADCEIVMSAVYGAELGEQIHVGPFAHLRPGTRIENGARVGNFVELKNTHLGPRSKASHLSYLGDAEIGPGCNIGAGTITCNYDGAAKHTTTLGENVFVGSNSTLVAPLTIGDEGFVAAGSTLTEDLPAGALGLGRARQVNKPGWSAAHRPRK